MNKNFAVLTADTHLQNRAWHHIPELWGDAYFAFEQIVTFARDNHFERVVVAGDGLDVKRNEPEPIDFVRRQISRLKNGNVRFQFIMGDHDTVDPPWFVAAHHYAEPIGRTGYQQDTVDDVIYGIDYQRAGDLEAALAAIPKSARLVVCHQKWDEFMGGQAITDGSLSLMPEHVRLVVTGDYHKHMVKKIRNRGGEIMQVLSPGATCKQAIDEPNNHKFFVFEKPTLKFHSVDLISRPTIRIKADTEKQLQGLLHDLELLFQDCTDVTKGLPEHIRKPILDFHYNSEIPSAYLRFAETVGDRGFIFPKEYYEETEEVTIERRDRQIVIERGLPGALEQLREAKGWDTADPRYLFARRLLENSDRKVVLQELKKECGLC